MKSQNSNTSLVALPKDTEEIVNKPEDVPWYFFFSTIYKYKIQLVGLILILGAFLFYFLSYWVEGHVQSAFIKSIPYKSIADACFTALVIGFSYEWIVRRESEGKLKDIIHKELETQTNTIID